MQFPLQFPPLDFYDVILQLALGTIIILLTAELLPIHDIPTNVMINKKRLQRVGTVSGILFLCVVSYYIFSIIQGT